MYGKGDAYCYQLDRLSAIIWAENTIQFIVAAGIVIYDIYRLVLRMMTAFQKSSWKSFCNVS
jgi:hypothetical protein